MKEHGSNFIVHNGVRCSLVAPQEADIKALMEQNIKTTMDVLEVAREHNLKVLLIHRFSNSKMDQTHALGVANKTCQLLGDSYRKHYGVDVR